MIYNTNSTVKLINKTVEDETSFNVDSLKK